MKAMKFFRIRALEVTRTRAAKSFAKAMACLATSLSTASVHADALPIQPGSWTLAILPDTQIYAQSYPQHYSAQTQWLADHAVSHNIRYVIHEGDITNNNVASHWNNALASMNLLNGAIPYSMAPGNHDYGPNGNAATRDSLFNSPSYFGPGSYYAQQPNIGGFFEAGKTDNSYHTFNAGGTDWLVLALEWGPRDAVVDWANDVVETHPDHKAILVTHAYMYNDETIYDWETKGASQSWNPNAYPIASVPGETINDGQQLWEKLVSKRNFQFTFNGHVLGDGTGFRSTLNENGDPVHQMLANYQMKAQGGMGDMRLLEFSADGQTVEVRTYSPVLDRYDTAYDQQFTLKMNELRAPLAPPTLDSVVAANLTTVSPTAPTDNNIAAIQFPQATNPGVGALQINRGDYQLSIAGNAVSYSQGVLLASITQHERVDLPGKRATVEVGRNSYGDGLMALSIMEAGNAADRELNFNAAVAYFQFAAGWQGAHVNANGSVAAGNRIEQSMVSRTAVGRFRVKLGVDPRQDGLLFAIGNNNDNIVVQTGVLADGTGWDVRVEDNATNHGATGEDKDFSFVYLPYETEGLIGGYYDGLANHSISSVGEFTMERLSVGKYELSIPNESPQTGMLLLAITHLATASGVTAPDDNILVYDSDPTGKFFINSYDLPTLGAQDTKFSWAFISFADPLAAPTIASADFNGDDVVDGSDFLIWQLNAGSQGGSPEGDANRDGVVDGDDFGVWKQQFGGSGGPKTTTKMLPLPEPSGASLIGVAWVSMLAARRAKRIL